MKISLNWISDFVDLQGVDVQKLLSKFTLTTAEIDGFEEKGKNISDVVVGRIVSVSEHPNSKKLHLLKVDNGQDVVDCVCGASNVKEDMLVAFAKLGANVCGTKIEKTLIAGVESFGMCCSKEELGLEEKSEGIWEIVDTLTVGSDIKKIYNIEDVVFEVDNKSLTNRPDLWGHYGIAREISAILSRPLKPLMISDLSYYADSSNLQIKVETSNCLRYSGLRIGNITQTKSPENMQIRLYYCGMRAINLLADLTNYVMMEVGQPMHAFDGRFIKSILVKEFDEKIKFTTLDGVERIIPAGTIMICNGNEPVAIAGVMGGENSEIKDDTNTIVLESANFDATSIRKTEMKLGHRTDSSSRYEKSLDPELTLTSIFRFVHILRMIDEHVTIQSGLVDVYRKHYDKKIITLSADFISKYMGINVSNEQIKKILTSLGFKVSFNGALIQIEVPTWRATKDITIPVDIVEEVARVYGYDNIEPKSVLSNLTPVSQHSEHIMEYDAKQMLAEIWGLNEVHSYIWNDIASNKNLNIITQGLVKVLNSTVKDNDEIRSAMIPSLLKTVFENRNSFDDIKIFEIGRVVTGFDENNLCVEEKHLGIVMASVVETEKELVFKLKTILDNLSLKLLKTSPNLKLKMANVDYIHPINNAEIFLDEERIGCFGVLNPKVKHNLGKKFNVAVLEIDFSKFAAHKKEVTNRVELTKYQQVNVDYNFVIDKTVCYAEIEKYLKGFLSNLKHNFKLKDVFVDEQLLPYKKSYTFGYTLYSQDHTLTGEEIEKFGSDLIEYAKQRNYVLR